MYKKPMSPPFDSVNNVERYVAGFLEKTFERITEIGGYYRNPEYPAFANWAEIIRVLRLDNDMIARPAKEKPLADAIEQWQLRDRQKREAEMASTLSYTGPNGELEKLLRAIAKSYRHLDLVVMQHWIWQVKRKLCGLPVTYHMMPVWYGPQSAGKSETIKKLLGPLGPDFAEQGVNFSVFTDYREAPILEKKYAFLLEEMAWSDRTAVETLKGALTANVRTHRTLGTHQMITIRQNGTFISTTNHPLSTSIFDTTGMRRFWQFEAVKPASWDDINNIDFLMIWKSVDEDAECYLLKHLQEISEIQFKDLTSKTNTTIFATEYCATGDEIETQAEKILEDFRAWELLHDPNKRTASRHFFQQLLLIPGVQKKMKNNRSHYTIKYTGERALKALPSAMAKVQ